MKATNLRWANAEQTLIDCTLDHPEFGPIPYTCGPDDPVSAEMFETLKTKRVAAYRPPAEPEPAEQPADPNAALKAAVVAAIDRDPTFREALEGALK